MRFGSWGRAVSAAGLIPNPQGAGQWRDPMPLPEGYRKKYVHMLRMHAPPVGAREPIRSGKAA